MKDFLWEGIDEGRGTYLVSWEMVGKPMGLRGLELGNLRLRNRVLLAKWLCLFPLESTSLWHRIIVSKYGHHPNEWLSSGVKGTRNPWKEIIYELLVFSGLVLFVEGMGSHFFS